MNAFPPMTGPRTRLRGLGEGVRFRDIPDLQAVTPSHWVAPSTDETLMTESIA
jgi:peptide/nickel transport system ATP-binding protein